MTQWGQKDLKIRNIVYFYETGLVSSKFQRLLHALPSHDFLKIASSTSTKLNLAFKYQVQPSSIFIFQSFLSSRKENHGNFRIKLTCWILHIALNPIRIGQSVKQCPMTEKSQSWSAKFPQEEMLCTLKSHLNSFVVWPVTRKNTQNNIYVLLTTNWREWSKEIKLN